MAELGMRDLQVLHEFTIGIVVPTTAWSPERVANHRFEFVPVIVRQVPRSATVLRVVVNLCSIFNLSLAATYLLVFY